jgi:hypothetical protein
MTNVNDGKPGNKPADTTAALEVIKRSPEHWAQRAFPMRRQGGTDAKPRMVSHPNFWQHKTAAALHGWADHAHHEGKPIEITGEAYYNALVAASEPKPQKRVEKYLDASGKEASREVPMPSQYVPCWDALSPHSHIAKLFKAAAAPAAS